MQIVQQSATFSYSLILPYPLLAAPPVPLALAAPPVRALLSAPKPVIVVEKRHWVDDILNEVGPFQSAEEMDDELMEIVDRIRERTIRHRMNRVAQ
jgi:hypothetical protein